MGRSDLNQMALLFLGLAPYTHATLDSLSKEMQLVTAKQMKPGLGQNRPVSVSLKYFQF